MISFFELMKDHKSNHSEYQMDNFITRLSGGSLYGQYKQALRELHTRFSALRQLYYERENLIIDIDELKDNELYKKTYERRRAKLELANKILSLNDLELSIRDTEEEFKRFYQQAVWLKNKIGPIDEERRLKLEEEAWVYWIKEKIALDIIVNKQLSKEAIEMIHVSPEHIKKDLIDFINSDKAIDWYENNKDLIEIPSNLPDIALPSKDEILPLTFND